MSPTTSVEVVKLINLHSETHLYQGRICSNYHIGAWSTAYIPRSASVREKWSRDMSRYLHVSSVHVKYWDTATFQVLTGGLPLLYRWREVQSNCDVGAWRWRGGRLII